MRGSDRNAVAGRFGGQTLQNYDRNGMRRQDDDDSDVTASSPSASENEILKLHPLLNTRSFLRILLRCERPVVSAVGRASSVKESVQFFMTPR